MPVDASALLSVLKGWVTRLEDDLREQADAVPEAKAELEQAYEAGRKADRIGDAFETWREGVLTQAAVHWVLGGVFVRFLEDNGLIDPMIAGAGERGEAAADRRGAFFRQPDHATDNERHYLLDVFATVGDLPAGGRLFDRAHNPVWRFPISGDAAKGLLQFWRRIDPDTGTLAHDFADFAWDTRFLGDLYQDLSAAARKTYALLQTPDFIEAFILGRTLEPALREFGLETTTCIDPTCGSGHFLLGAFERLLRRWQTKEPGTLPEALVQKALDGVYGVDLNPFAVAIARFRLLMAALKASDTRRLAQAPAFRLHVAAGDTLLAGVVKGQTEFPEFYAWEDGAEVYEILSKRYHAVVGNPPYISVKDRALRDRYRALYDSCHGKYALSAPFTERFWELALSGTDTQPAGFVGLINANSFMKREFGKKLVEGFFPGVDLTHVVDTSGAYIPGHGTPTVILFGRHRQPVGDSVRAVLGIRGEPGTPADPASAQVWTSIGRGIDQPGFEDEFVSVVDSSREAFETHPWSLKGGAASAVKETVEAGARPLADLVDSVGIVSFTSEDSVYLADGLSLKRIGVEDEVTRVSVAGDELRDWAHTPTAVALFPYDAQYQPVDIAEHSGAASYLWRFRTTLGGSVLFAGKTKQDVDMEWYEYGRLTHSKLLTPFIIAFAFVATHNHFVLDRGGKVFKQSAPVVKMSASSTESDHFAILGVLNSSVACFWLKESSHNAGDSTDTKGARVTGDPAFDTYHYNGTQVGQLPIPDEKPLALAESLDALAQDRQQRLPAALADSLPMPRATWEQNRSQADRLLREMIALQEELDWRCYRLYGVTRDELTYQDGTGQPLTPPDVQLGERAFEIAMARRMAAGDLTTAWFERHGSTPITEVPARWPADYRALVERRIEQIESDRYAGLLERPEYKRRWNVPAWDDQASDALRGWLQTRLEGAQYWSGDPRLRTVHQLADTAERDADFMAVAELYRGEAGFDVGTLVADLVAPEAVPLLPAERYKPPGLRKRKVWEQTWAKQRQEDAIDREVEASLARNANETDTMFAERLAATQKVRKEREIGAIPRPPNYASADFLGDFWKLRGKLDVPKERFVSYPHGAPDTDPSLLVGWAGWTHLEQAMALAARIEDAKNEGWAPERLVPLYAGLAELEPWLIQWHNDLDPAMNLRMGDYFKEYLDGELHRQGITREALAAWSPPKKQRRRRAAS